MHHPFGGLCVQQREVHQCIRRKRKKVGGLKKLEKNPRLHKLFRQLGDDRSIKSQVLKQLEQFTCLMYGQSRASVDVVHAKLLRNMIGEDEKVDMVRFPPWLLCSEATHPACEPPHHLVQAS